MSGRAPAEKAAVATLPVEAQLLLTRWRGLCDQLGSQPHGLTGGYRLPDLHDLAPAMVPPSLLPWSMTFRRDPDRKLTYGVVGEELAFLFHGNPRGKPVLHYADAAVRDARYAVIHRALDDGLPVWYTARLLFESGDAEIGRLGLPTRIETGEALLLVYLPLSPLPDLPQRLQRLGEGPSQTLWLDRCQV